MNTEKHTHIVLRLAGPADTPALRRLEDLEGRSLPAGEALVAIVDGSMVAAVGMKAGEIVADPFEHTADMVARLMEARSQTLGSAAPRRGLLARLRHPGTRQKSTPRAAGAPAVPGSESLLLR